jgi:hypothetical protein
VSRALLHHVVKSLFGLQCRILLQVRDALGGLTFSKTPSFNYTSLQQSPLTFTDQYGDDRNTTYSADTVTAPAFDTKYARVRSLRGDVLRLYLMLDVVVWQGLTCCSQVFAQPAEAQVSAPASERSCA